MKTYKIIFDFSGAFVMDEHFTGGVAAVRNNLISAFERSKQEYHGRPIFHNDFVLGGKQIKLLSALSWGRPSAWAITAARRG